MANLAFTIEHIKERVKKCSRCGDDFCACCPAHEDRDPSFTFKENGEKITFTCYAGCSGDDILKALDLTWDDIYSDRAQEERKGQRKFNVKPSRPQPPPTKPKEDPPPDFKPLLEAAHAMPTHRQRLLELADELGATPESREAYADAAELLGVVWVSKCKTLLPFLPRDGRGWVPCWCIPERDADGNVIGLMRRYPGGEKKAWPDGKRGLTYADDWTNHGDRDKPVLLPEGASDVIALLACGFLVIGRPSNVGGVELLCETLSVVPVGHPIVVLGENDRKLNKAGQEKWPGKEGMEKVAGNLAQSLPSAKVYTSMPLNERKDARQALEGEAGLLSWEEFLGLFSDPNLCPYIAPMCHNPIEKNDDLKRDSSTSDQLSNLLPGLSYPPPAAACPRCVGATILQNIEDPTRWRSTRRACDNWGCTCCKRRNAHEWVTHLAGEMVEAVRERFTLDKDKGNGAAYSLYMARMTIGEFDRKLSRAIQAVRVTYIHDGEAHVRHAEWCALEMAGLYLVLVAVPEGADPPAGVQPISLSEACLELVAWTDFVRITPEPFVSRGELKKFRPVRTSIGWRLNAKPRKKPEWKEITSIDASDIDAVLDIVRQEGGKITCETASPGEDRGSTSSLIWLLEWRADPETAQRITDRLRELGEPLVRLRRRPEDEEGYTPFDDPVPEAGSKL